MILDTSKETSLRKLISDYPMITLLVVDNESATILRSTPPRYLVGGICVGPHFIEYDIIREIWGLVYPDPRYPNPRISIGDKLRIVTRDKEVIYIGVDSLPIRLPSLDWSRVDYVDKLIIADPETVPHQSLAKYEMPLPKCFEPMPWLDKLRHDEELMEETEAVEETPKTVLPNGIRPGKRLGTFIVGDEE